MARPFTRRLYSSSPPDQIQSQTLISSAISILIHHRSKTRWSYLRSLLSPNGITPSEFSQISLHLKNNPRLALNFFTWSSTKSLCNHNLISYATIIHILARSRLKTQALTLIRNAMCVSESNSLLKLFEILAKTFRECGSAPFVFDLLIESCLESKRIDEAIAIVRMLQSRGISPQIATCNSLILSVSRSRGAESGYSIYNEVFGINCEDDSKKLKIKTSPNVQTFNTLMISYYQEEGNLEKMENIFDEMENLKITANTYSYSILMAAYCDEEKMVKVENLYKEMKVKQIELDIITFNTIIGGYCKIIEIKKAEEFFEEMELSGLKSTCVTYENLINGYCKINDIDSAIFLYKTMISKGFKVESLIIDSLIKLLCDKNRVKEAMEYLKVAEKGDVCFPPSGKSYERVIKGLCREGDMDAALTVQASIIGKGFKLSLDIYDDFIHGYVKIGNEEVAKRLRKEMFESQSCGS